MNITQTSKKYFDKCFLSTFIGIIFVFYSTITFSQNYFEKQFGSVGTDVSRSIIQTQTGSIFIAGYQDTAQQGNINFLLSKCNKNGDVLFVKNFGDSLVENCFAILPFNNNSILLAGEKYTSNTNFDGLIYSIDTLGNIIWQLQIGGLFSNESIKSIIKTSDGNLLASGFISDVNNSNDFLVVKISATGNIIWQKTFGDDKNNTAISCIELSNGNYAIAGDGQSHAGDYDVMLVVTDANGNEIWQNRFGDGFQNGSQGIFESTDHNIIVYGETEISTASPFDFFVQKINFIGTSIWRKTFGGAKSDAIFSGVEVDDGFVFTGYSNSYNSGPLNLVVLKTDTAASYIKWLNNFGGNGVDIGYKIIKSNTDAGFYIAGIYDDFGNTNNYLLHVTSNGFATQNEIKQPPQIMLCPNPTNGLVKINSNNIEADVTIYDNTGNIVLLNRITEKEFYLNNLKKGVYFVNIKTKENVFVSKLILE